LAKVSLSKIVRATLLKSVCPCSGDVNYMTSIVYNAVLISGFVSAETHLLTTTLEWYWHEYLPKHAFQDDYRRFVDSDFSRDIPTNLESV